jgi:hypothetical protein
VKGKVAMVKMISGEFERERDFVSNLLLFLVRLSRAVHDWHTLLLAAVKILQCCDGAPAMLSSFSFFARNR